MGIIENTLGVGGEREKITDEERKETQKKAVDFIRKGEKESNFHKALRALEEGKDTDEILSMLPEEIRASVERQLRGELKEIMTSEDNSQNK